MQGSPSSPTHSVMSTATGWHAAASIRAGPSGPPSEAGDWQGAGQGWDPDQWGPGELSLRPTTSHASFTTQPDRHEDGGLGYGHTLRALPSSSGILDLSGPPSGGGVMMTAQGDLSSAAAAAIGAGVQRLGVRLESRADLRRLVDMLERRLEKVRVCMWW
jgi:hypothetical protein